MRLLCYSPVSSAHLDTKGRSSATHRETKTFEDTYESPLSSTVEGFEGDPTIGGRPQLWVDGLRFMQRIVIRLWF